MRARIESSGARDRDGAMVALVGDARVVVDGRMTVELRGRIRRYGDDEDQGGSRWLFCDCRDVEREGTRRSVDGCQDVKERLCSVAASLDQGSNVAMSREPIRRGKLARMTLHDSNGRCLVRSAVLNLRPLDRP